MNRSVDYVMYVFDLIVYLIFFKKFILKKGEGTIGKKLLICLCMICLTTSWSELFFEFEYACRDSWGDIFLIFFEHIGIWGFLAGILYMDKKYEYDDKDNMKLIIIMACFPMLGTAWEVGYNLYIDPSWDNSQYVRFAQHVGFITWVILISLNYLLCILYYAIKKVQRERSENMMLVQQYEAEKRHYDDIKQMEQEVRGVRHDLNNLLSTAQILLTQKDYIGVEELIRGTKDRVENAENIIHTGNTAIDSVLNLKLGKASKMGMKIETNINIPAELNLNYEAMATIFGNLLDNAIEAQDKIAKNERKIVLNIRYMNGMLVIAVANPGMQNVTLTTTKEDNKNHGYGISNIKRSVEQLGGSIRFEWDKNMFFAKILLYNVEPKTKNDIESYQK